MCGPDVEADLGHSLRTERERCAAQSKLLRVFADYSGSEKPDDAFSLFSFDPCCSTHAPEVEPPRSKRVDRVQPSQRFADHCRGLAIERDRIHEVLSSAELPEKILEIHRRDSCRAFGVLKH